MTLSSEFQSDKTGLAPGTLVHISDIHESEINVSIINFSEAHYEEIISTSVDDMYKYMGTKSTTWINIEGLHDINLIDRIGKKFNIHSLVLEDILNTNQRTKIEEYDDQLFIVFKRLFIDKKRKFVDYEQIGILLLDNYIFTFKEKSDDLFKSIKSRLENSKGNLRKYGVDYLAYALIDTTVDYYFKFDDLLDDVIESIEEDLLSQPSRETLNKIQNIRKEIIFVRRNITPLRDVLVTLLHSDSAIIKQTTKIYFRDVFDHTLRVIESIDSYRELASSLLEVYLSSISNRMNEIMKVLTIFASIFIPLTFIVGIYGMNFQYMPELTWKWSYPILWVLFILVPIIFLAYFKRKKWL